MNQCKICARATKTDSKTGLCVTCTESLACVKDLLRYKKGNLAIITEIARTRNIKIYEGIFSPITFNNHILRKNNV